MIVHDTQPSFYFLQRRKTNKARDGTTPHGATAAESVRNLIKKNPKYSKRINYDALKDLFTDADTGSPVPLIKMSNTPTPGPSSVQEDQELDEGGETDHGSVYPTSDVEGAGVVVVEEEGGGGVGVAVGVGIGAEKRKGSVGADVDEGGDTDADAVGDDDDDMYADADGEVEGGDGNYVEWDGYEQEV